MSFNICYLLQALFPNTATLGIRASTYEWGEGDKIHSRTHFLLLLRFFLYLWFLAIFFSCFVCFFILQVLIRHQFYTHQCIHVNPNRPIQHTTIPTPLQFSPLGVHMFVLYICVSTSALQTGSSVPFFQVPHTCVNIRYLFFSFSLTSFCMTVSRFIHISTNDPISFLFFKLEF